MEERFTQRVCRTGVRSTGTAVYGTSVRSDGFYHEMAGLAA